MRKIVFTPSIGPAITLGIFDPLNDKYLIESLEGIDMPKSRMQSQKSPFQDGQTFIDVLFEPRDIVVQGSINANSWSSIYAARAVLINALNPKLGLGVLSFYNDTYPTTPIVINAIAVNSPQFKNKNFNDGFQKFMITFECPDPYFYLADVDVALVRAVSTELVNPGQTLSPCSFRITGPCVNPKIKNDTTGEWFKFTKTLASNSNFIDVVTTPGSISAVDDAGANVMGLLVAGSTMWQAVTGSNYSTYSEDGTAAGVGHIYISPRIFGV
jgi:hypothetical protein